MKAMRLLFCAMLVVFMSCENEVSKEEVPGLEFETTFEKMTGSDIGYLEGNKVKLGVSDETIMKTFKDFSFKSGLNLEPQSFEIIEVNGLNYLRFYSKDHTASTIALLKGNQNKVITGGTVCTSSACSACCGCLPDGEYCTKCERYQPLPGGPENDCLRSTAG